MSKQENKDAAKGCILMLVVIGFVLWLVWPDGEKEPEIGKPAEPVMTEGERKALERKNSIDRQFSGWDGSHTNLKEWIKDGMHDPDSFKHVQTTYRDMGGHLIVTTKFRGSNLYGATVTNSLTAKVDLYGNVTEIIE